MKKYSSILLIILLISCNSKTQKKTESTKTILNTQLNSSGILYHYSIWYAFVNRVFDGNLNVKELKTKGDVALGSFNALSGELVMNKGTVYRISEDGTVHVANGSEKICYTNATFFNTDQEFDLTHILNYDSLRQKLNRKIPSKNLFYAFMITGKFKSIKLGSLRPQKKPYKVGLDVLLPKRPIFEDNNVSGTMVGFFCPQFIGNINVAGYHFHFISDDAKIGGHVIEFEADKLHIAVDYIYKYQFVLPKSEEYMSVNLKKEFQYNK